MLQTSNLTVYVVIAFVAVIIGISKGGLGSALGSIATPLVALVLPADRALGTALILLLVGDAFAIWAHWRRWDIKIIIATIPTSLVGVIIASALLSNLSASTIQHGIGLLSLVYVIWKVLERRIRREVREVKTENLPRWLAPSVGLVGGFVSTVSNAAGPVYTAYLLLLHLQPETFAATAALYFALVNAMKVPGYIAAGIFHPEAVLPFLWAVPLIFLGVRLGKLIDHYLDIRTFETVIIVLLAFTAAFLLLR